MATGNRAYAKALMTARRRIARKNSESIEDVEANVARRYSRNPAWLDRRVQGLTERGQDFSPGQRTFKLHEAHTGFHR